jgi:sarcosine oxidase subunit gamma
MSPLASASIERVAPLAQVTLRVAPDAAVLERLGRALGVPIPTDPNRVSVSAAGRRAVLWAGPDEWLIVDEDRAAATAIEAAVRGATSDAFVVTVDVSENRVAFDIAGPAARDLLEGGITVDLHPRAFTVGSCAQTLLARANVLLWQRTDDPSYRLLVRPSFAAYVERWLRDGIEGLGSWSSQPSGP